MSDPRSSVPANTSSDVNEVSGSLIVSRAGVDGQVLVMTINRPSRRNAVDREVAEAISDAMEMLESDDGLRVGILRGNGGYFSAGSDLTLKSAPLTDGGEYGFIRRSRTRPLIAAIEGFALGGGMEMAMGCDLVVAASDATFGLPETLRGVVARCGGLFRTSEKLTPNLAMELLLTGNRLPATRAYDLGFVNRLAEPEGALSAALALAEEISAASPAAIAASMRAMAVARNRVEPDLWDLSAQAADEAATSPDFEEGKTAFFEKRPPRWA